MSIFKKAIASGEYPIQDIDIDPDFRKDFYNTHNRYLKNKYKPGDKIPQQNNHESYILQNNGDIDTLKEHHIWHIKNVSGNLAPEHRQYEQELLKKHYLETYEKIHHYFNGGMRLFFENHKLYISGNQIPTEQQLISLDRFIDQIHPMSFSIELRLNKPINPKDSFDNFYHDMPNYFNIRTPSWEKAKQYIRSLSSKSHAPSEEVLQRIQRLQSFRTPDWAEERKPMIPDSLYQGNNFTQKQLKKFKDYIPPIIQKQRGAPQVGVPQPTEPKPNSKIIKTWILQNNIQNMNQYLKNKPKNFPIELPTFLTNFFIGHHTSSVFKNLLKYAEILDTKKEYIKADMIVNFIKEAISAEDIDWSQPNAYIMYMDALKQNQQNQSIVEENKPKKNSLLTRLQNGFYNDVLVSELAKLAESLGFVVTANGQHFKFTDTTGKLRDSGSEKYRSGVISIGGHKHNNQGVADYQGTQDFARALKYLGYL